MKELTHDQKAIHFETFQHIHEVQKLLYLMQVEIGRRALAHDLSKIYSDEECETFAEYTPKLKDLRYGSKEYKECLKEMGSAVEHHQKSNRHHPEAFQNGINGMNLIDILEMLCDWKAATKRTLNGDLNKSLIINKERFQISEQLLAIFKNTFPLLETTVNTKQELPNG